MTKKRTHILALVWSNRFHPGILNASVFLPPPMQLTYRWSIVELFCETSLLVWFRSGYLPDIGLSIPLLALQLGDLSLFL